MTRYDRYCELCAEVGDTVGNFEPDDIERYAYVEKVTTKKKTVFEVFTEADVGTIRENDNGNTTRIVDLDTGEDLPLETRETRYKAALDAHTMGHAFDPEEGADIDRYLLLQANDGVYWAYTEATLQELETHMNDDGWPPAEVIDLDTDAVLPFEVKIVIDWKGKVTS